MWMEWLVEIGLGILRVTWQPLLYAAIIFAFWTGYKRIEKERKQFGHRIFEITAEWKKLGNRPVVWLASFYRDFIDRRID